MTEPKTFVVTLNDADALIAPVRYSSKEHGVVIYMDRSQADAYRVTIEPINRKRERKLDVMAGYGLDRDECEELLEALEAIDSEDP